MNKRNSKKSFIAHMQAKYNVSEEQVIQSLDELEELKFIKTTNNMIMSNDHVTQEKVFNLMIEDIINDQKKESYIHLPGYYSSK